MLSSQTAIRDLEKSASKMRCWNKSGMTAAINSIFEMGSDNFMACLHLPTY
jgi:hypothetical protein